MIRVLSDLASLVLVAAPLMNCAQDVLVPKSKHSKKIAVDFEIQDKMRLKEQIKSLRNEIKTLKKPKEVSKRLAPEKKSPAKNA